MADVSKEMDQLPYFLLLLQKNVLLYSLITAGSFAEVDLTHVKHRVYSDHAIEITDFALGENDNFTSVRIMIMESGTSLTFHTTSNKYFDKPEIYFNRSGLETSGNIYSINGSPTKTHKKSLGNFIVFPYPVPPASVWVRNSSTYGYVVSIQFIKNN